MAPAKYCGIGEQQNGNGDEFGADGAKDAGKCLPYQTGAFYVSQHLPCLKVHKTGGEDTESG